jgi:hypothetical protein
MGRGEKAIWTLVMLSLLGLELRTLYLDRNEHDAEQKLAQCQQLRSFQEIAQSIGSSISAGEAQFQATIGHVDRVLGTTQKVADLSEDNLENVTGGNAFAYVTLPTTARKYLRPSNSTTAFTLTIHNGGKEILSGVTISVAHVFSEDGRSDLVDGGLSHAVNVGSLGRYERKMVPDFYLAPLRDDPTGHPHYVVLIEAQNGIVSEDLWLRPASDGLGWASKYRVTRTINGKKERALLDKNWMEPATPPE